MACELLKNGQDNSCRITQKGYAQELVLVNMSDIVEKGITIDCETSAYKATPVLKEGAKGVLFKGPEAGNIIRVITNKTRDDNGYPQYEHGVNLPISGVTQEQKCILSALDNGRFVAFAKLRTYDEVGSGTMVEAIEIVGLVNGLSTGDREYNITETSGVVTIELRSTEGLFESDEPYMYESTTPGSEILDFEALFENAI